MLKLFLTASGTSGFASTSSSLGALSFALLYSFKTTRMNVLNSITNMGSLMNRGFLPFIVGGLLLGAGLDIAGTCPGMVYVEVEDWVVFVADGSIGSEQSVDLCGLYDWNVCLHSNPASSVWFALLICSDREVVDVFFLLSENSDGGHGNRLPCVGGSLCGSSLHHCVDCEFVLPLA